MTFLLPLPTAFVFHNKRPLSAPIILSLMRMRKSHSPFTVGSSCSQAHRQQQVESEKKYKRTSAPIPFYRKLVILEVFHGKPFS